jgi:purine nucleoside permease
VRPIKDSYESNRLQWNRRLLNIAILDLLKKNQPVKVGKAVSLLQFELGMGKDNAINSIKVLFDMKKINIDTNEDITLMGD